MDDDDESVLLSGSDAQKDNWLTDEEYGSGRGWGRFCLERILSMLQSTRMTTSMLEFLARSGGWYCYYPVEIWEVKMENINPFANISSAVYLLVDDNGVPYLTQNGRPMYHHGYDLVPSLFSRGKLEVSGSNGKRRKGKPRKRFPGSVMFSWILPALTRRGSREVGESESDVESSFASIRTLLAKMLSWMLLIFANRGTKGTSEKGSEEEKIVKEMQILLSNPTEAKAPKKESLSKRFISKFRKHEDKIKLEFSFKMPNGKWVPKYLKKSDLRRVRRWIPTPIPDGSFEQAPRLPFEMIPKPELDDALILEAAVRERYRKAARCRNQRKLNGKGWRNLPGEWVEYQFCGVPGLDGELLRLQQTGRAPRVNKLPAQLRRLVNHGIPLWKCEDGKILVVRWLETETGMTMRVHRQLADNYITAEQVFTKLDQMKEDPLTEYDPDPARVIPPQFYTVMVGRTKAQIEDLVRQYLVDLSQTDPLEAARKQKIIRKSFEKWIETWYDRKYPCEQYEYRNWFYDLQKLHVNNWKSRADRWWFQMKLRIYFEAEPGITSSTLQRANFLLMRLRIADFESWRNLEHMQEHWKYSKAFLNTVSAYNADRNAPQNMRQRDWGGIWNPTEAKNDWRFAWLDKIAPKSKPTLRMLLLGPAWFDKDPDDMMDHDGSQIERFGQKKSGGWVKAQGDIKGYSSKSGTASFPKRIEGGLDKELADYRNYRSEYDLLTNDEYFARDPVDVVLHQKGIFIKSIIDDNNLRLKARFKAANTRLARRGEDQVILDYDNCFAVQDFIVLMWKNLPVGPIVNGVEGTLKSWKENNVLHLRHKLEEWLKGIHINHELQPYLEKWYEESDDRVWDFVVWLEEMGSGEGLHGASGSGGFSLPMASKLNDEGFGLGYGTFLEQQQRQERLVALALFSGYYTEIKRVCSWFSVRLTAVHMTISTTKEGGIVPDKSWDNLLNEMKMEVAGTVKSGKLLDIVARHSLWPRLRTISNGALTEEYPEIDPVALQVDEDFIDEQIAPLVGNPYRPSLATVEKNPAHPYAAVLFNEMEKNFRRYRRVQEGRFFAINLA